MSPLLATFLVILIVAAPISGLNPRKLDEAPGSPSSDVKCGGCPACSSPCYQSPPPPALPPPPPALPPPPPPPKKPPTPSQYCPPPPSSFIYIQGPPGDLYPIDTNFSGSTWSSVVGLPLLVICGILELLAYW